MKKSFASLLKKKVDNGTITEEEYERILRAHYEYCKENKAYIGALLKENARSRYSCVNEKESATMVEYDKYDEF